MKLTSAIKAFPILILQADEPLRAIRELATEFQGTDTNILVWDVMGGVRPFAKWNQLVSKSQDEGNAAGRQPSPPLTPIIALHDVPTRVRRADGRGEDPAPPTIMVALNYHRALRSDSQVVVIQALLDGCRIWASDRRRFVIVCPPGTEMPDEIRRYVHVYDHELPTVEDLTKTIRANVEAQRALIKRQEEQGDLPRAEAQKALRKLQMTDADIQAVAQMGRGLTLFEFANALAVSLAEHGGIRLDVIADEKEQMLRASDVLEWARSEWVFSTIGGEAVVKKYLLATVGQPGARGALFLGVPGVGKTITAFALANESHLPALVLSMTAATNSAYGGTEQRVIRAIKTIRAMGRCIVIMDEIEKMLAGASKDAYTGDSGTSKRSAGELLKFLADPQEAYPVATCNDLNSMDPEYIRRFDVVFFFDIPTPEERDVIAALYAQKYGVALEPRPDDHGWTGDEIEKAYRLAQTMGHADTTESRTYITPLYTTQREKIEALRTWAQGRAKWASDRSAEGGETSEVVRLVV